MPSNCEVVESEAQPVTCAVLESGPCSACKDRETIRWEIEKLERKIVKLKAKYDTLATTMNAIHDPFIHKLPPEIASHVFRLSLPTYGIERTRDLVAGSLRLGAVCRKWRQLAWATPDLWDSVYVSVTKRMSYSLANSLPVLLREWLYRSSMLPLTIIFRHTYRDFEEDSYEDEFSNDDSEFISQAMIDALEVAAGLAIETLNLHSGRWRNLILSASAPTFKRLSGSIQPLQLVHLKLSNFSSMESLPEFKLESKFSPTRFELLDFPLTSVNIDYENVTYASIAGGTSHQEVLDFLRRAPNLEHFNVYMKQRFPMTDLEVPIRHPRLRSLRLVTYNLSNFLEIINLPALEEWTLRFRRDYVYPSSAAQSVTSRP